MRAGMGASPAGIENSSTPSTASGAPVMAGVHSARKPRRTSAIGSSHCGARAAASLASIRCRSAGCRAIAAACLHLLEQMTEGAAHFELVVASFEVDNLIAAQVAADLRDRVDANDGGAMDLPELLRVELFDQFLDWLANQRLEGFGLHARVFVLGTEEQDVAGRDHADRGAHARLHPPQVLARPQSTVHSAAPE